jgi:endonuclease/exonuclease/phosphatase family metal-dependent hydrolase
VNADVWVLTETWEQFSPGDGYRLAAESSLADDLKTWPDRRWVAIWVKSAFEAKRQEVHSQPDRMACAQIKKPGQRDVVVIGTVLPWHFDPLWLYPAGFFAALAIQVDEWGRLWGTPRTSGFIVAGDFNQSLPCQKRRGSEQGEIALKEALKSHDVLCLTEGSDSLTGIPRIDHICVSRTALRPTFIPQAGEWPIPCIGEKEISDHSGVFADLEFS